MIAAISRASNSSVHVDAVDLAPDGRSLGNIAIISSLVLMFMALFSIYLSSIERNTTKSAARCKKIHHPTESSTLNSFGPIGNDVFYRRSTIPTEQDHDDPDLIVLCTWMGAAHTYITKYTNTYATQFPSASQLVVSSSLADMTWRSHTSQGDRIHPAVKILTSTLEKNPHARILLHIFSDGGANSACQLATQLRVCTNRPFPAAAMILDSTPGLRAYKTCRDAIVNSMPSSFLVRSIGTPFTHMYLTYVWIIETFLGVENVRERRRLDLNDGKLFSSHAPRLYVYSKADKIIPWTGVEEHSDAAENAGLRVERRRFEDTPHVGHIRRYAGTYWEAVNVFWANTGFRERV
jgi:hypothetical protein